MCNVHSAHVNVFVGHLSTMVEKEAEYVGCPDLVLTIPDQFMSGDCFDNVVAEE